MTEERPERELDALEARLREARGKAEDTRPESKDINQPSGSALGLAFRVGVELVSALAIGVAIGWLLDQWLGTRPWLMVVFFFIGAAAGMLNVYRTVAGFGLAAGYRPPGKDQPEDKGPED